jgi:hypothetical protein
MAISEKMLVDEICRDMFTRKPKAMHRVMIVYVLPSDGMEYERQKKTDLKLYFL